MNTNDSISSEKILVNDYLQECNGLLKSGFNKTRVKDFTKKYLDRQLYGPKLSKSFDPSILKSLRDRSALEVQNLILNGQVSYAEVVEQYHQIKVNHKNANCWLTWSRFEEPLKRAKELDSELQGLGPEKMKEKYPLLGFVMSIKDCIYAKDTPNTGGLFINLDRVATEDPEMIKALKNKGAVFTSKGNVPQMLFAFESDNNLFGEAVHELDKTRTVGGSTGGDSAMVSFGYTNCAMGSDIGGSLRIPALFNGICSLKPTSRRLSTQAQPNFFSRNFGSDQLNPQKVVSAEDKQFIIPVTVGPLAKKVEDLEVMMKVMLEDQSHDLRVVPLPWKKEVDFPKRVGVIREIKKVELGPTAKRVLDESISALQKAGYQIVELPVEDILLEILEASIIAFNKNHELFKSISGKINVYEKFGKLFSLAKLVHSLPLWVVKLARWKEGSTRKGFIMENFIKSKTTSSQMLLEIQSKCYQKLHQKMKEHDLSALVSPGMPMPALRLGNSNKCFLSCLYMFMYNFLDMPSGALTIGTVREDEQFYESEFDDEMTKTLKENAEGSALLPMGVLVSSRAFQEEVVVQVMKDIQNNLK